MRRKPKPQTWWALRFLKDGTFYPTGTVPYGWFNKRRALEARQRLTFNDGDDLQCDVVRVKLVEVK